MTLLRCATLVVEDIDAATACYAEWLDYSMVESGTIPAHLAAAWQAPASAGKRYAVMEPQSGEPVFLRFVEGDPVPDYLPIRTYGWAATEICVTDVEAVHQRMLASPFEVIGPPRPLDGYATIKPMQVRGPEAEIVYLTEFARDDPALALPQPKTLIDRPFIMVHACRDLNAGLVWLRDVLGLQAIDPVSIRYTMIERAFDLTPEDKTAITTAQWPGGETFLEFDQYPEAAKDRPKHLGALPPGVAIVTMLHPELARLEGHWLSPPVRREGPLYEGRTVGVLQTPEGALLEVIDAG
ncbi:VOC family protein [Novosphingobium sp.]|uniref:VOC family protein n=1 Tax=Novosphingobium sp. TaxID=1874826 RepID=UPI00286E33F6|nr:VOC family protein [Novosphingobium sp.]